MGRSASVKRADARPRASGQALVEFALLIPLFMVLLIGLIEFSFAFNAMLNTNYASRAGGLIAAQTGNASAADCYILDAIETAYNAPAEKAQIARIEVQRTNPSGSTVYSSSAYRRSGSMTCTTVDGGTLSVPYSAVTTGYPPVQRCNVLPPYGCPTLTPARTTVDTIAVQVSYTYPWHTPLKGLITLIDGSMAGSGFSFVERNVFRMEPIL